MVTSFPGSGIDFFFSCQLSQKKKKYGTDEKGFFSYHFRVFEMPICPLAVNKGNSWMVKRSLYMNYDFDSQP